MSRPSAKGIKRAGARTDVQRMAAPSLISCAIEAMKRARRDLKSAGANVAASRAHNAIKSAEGALRHAERMSPFYEITQKYANGGGQ